MPAPGDTERSSAAARPRAGAQRPLRIAMWSGPRNISTALMRSWEARGDAAVSDEPFYAHYLLETGADHPGRDDVIALHETDWRAVVDELRGPVPAGQSIWYQKHMAHHLLPGIDRGWLLDDDAPITCCFLVRDPAEMIPSLAKVLERPVLEDTGLPQQVELFDQLRERRGVAPPVIDARDVLEDPAGTLRALCARLGIPFTERMLSWPPGRRATDGAWAPHWYASVEASTGFERRAPRREPVPPGLERLLENCRDFHAILEPHRIRPQAPAS